MSSPSRESLPLRHHLPALLVFAALFGWMFARFFLQNLYLSDSDLYDYFLPLFLSEVRRWSSFEFSGLPAFADPGQFNYYMPTLVFGLVLKSWTLLVMSAYVLAACFTYAYVYRLTRSRLAALFSALAYSLCEAMLERMAHLGSVHAAAWVPLIALAIERLRERTTALWLALGALAVANCILSGHPQPAIYAMYATGLYGLTGLVVGRLRWQRYASLASMFLLGATMAAIKLIPLIEASTYIARQQLNFERFMGRFMTAPQTLSVLFPTILHNDTREVPTYVGIATLLMALLALARLRRNWRIAFWATVCVLAFLLALGPVTPLVNLAYSVPLYDRFRNISRHLFLFAFGLSVLAGFGVAALQRHEVSPRAIRAAAAALLLGIGGGAVAIALAPGAFEFETIWREAAPGALSFLAVGIWIQIGIAAAAVALLFWMARAGTRPIPATLLILLLIGDLLSALPHNVLVDGVEFTSVDAAATGPSVHAQRLTAAVAPTAGRLLAVHGTQTDQVVPGSWARVWLTPIAGGYGPMLLDRYSQLAAIGTNGEIRPATLGDRDAALDLLAVRYVIVDGDETDPIVQEWLRTARWQQAESFTTSLSTDRGVDRDEKNESAVMVFENLRALPRAWIVPTVLPLGDPEALKAIHESRLPDGSAFDPRQVAIVAPEAGALPRGGGTGTVQITGLDDGEFTLAASSPAGGFLVLSENYYPGWRARIDGRDTAVYRADVTLQAIAIPPGSHRVSFTLESQTLRTGQSISGAASVLMLLLLGYSLVQRLRTVGPSMRRGDAADGVSRRRRAARWSAALGTSGLVLLGTMYWLTIEPAPSIRVRWSEGVTPDQQATLERRYLLRHGQLPIGRSIAYDLMDTSQRNIAAMVRDRAIAGTTDIDRQRLKVPFETEYGRDWMWLAHRIPGLRNDLWRRTLVALLVLMTIVGLATLLFERSRRTPDYKRPI